MTDIVDIKPILKKALVGPDDKLGRNDLRDLARQLEKEGKLEEAKMLRRLAQEGVYRTVEKKKNYERKELVTSDLFVKADRNFDGVLDSREIDELDYQIVRDQNDREQRDKFRDGKITDGDLKELEQTNQADIYLMLKKLFYDKGEKPIQSGDLLDRANELEKKFPGNRNFDREIALFRRLAKPEVFDKIAVPKEAKPSGGLYLPQIDELANASGDGSSVTIEDILAIEKSSKRIR